MASKTLGEKLISAASAVDWAQNISSFAKQSKLKEQAAKANYRIAVWAKQFETADSGNSALAFVREMQVQGHYASTLISLALYKPAASAMRAMFESALYYTYYRTHPLELNTLVRDRDYFLDKATILDFHKRHSVDFKTKQEAFGLLSRIKIWYGTQSAIIHGQLPGKWTTHKRLQCITFEENICKEAVTAFEEGEKLTHWLFLCTVDISLWYKFNKTAKDHLLKRQGPVRTSTFST